MKKEYYLVKDFIGWDKTEQFVQDLILKYNLKTILEVGAGANPTINPDFIKKHRLNYTISDIDDIELKKANGCYSTIVIDLSSPDFSLPQKFDLVFSRMAGEHITDAKTFHMNIFNILNNNGISFHCFSTLYALPFLINKIVPTGLSEFILDKISPRDKHFHGKFKAYYDWSRGPLKKIILQFERIGFEVIEYIGYFGHNYYKKFPVLNKLEEIKSKLLLKFPIPILTSYSYIILKKTVR
jgi:hypothetical protein